jgi:GTPase SAR1 family protein
MKHGLLLGLDGAGKTLLLRQLALQLLKSRKSVVDRLVALAQRGSCMGSTSASAVATRDSSSSTPPDLAPDGGNPSPSGVSASTVLLQNARNFASHHPTLALVYGSGAPKEEKTLDHETQPTIGVEHTALTIEGRTFSICEVGGQLLPMWKAYFDASEFWIYVVDISSPTALVAAAIELFNILKVETMRRKPKLLLLNKMDACFTVDDATIRTYLCLDRLMTDAFSPASPSGPMHVVKISALSGENVDAVLKWISHRWYNNSSGGAVGPSPAHVEVSGGSPLAGFSISGRMSIFNKNEKQRVRPVTQ